MPESSTPARSDSTARRGRPTADQATALTAKLVRIAREMFLADGYAATSMDAVATSAGVSKNTLYSRFPGKPDLFRAVVADRLQSWSRLSPREASAPRDDAVERLTARAIAAFDTLRDPEVGAFRRLIMREAHAFPELAEDFQFLGYRRLIHDVTLEIERSPAVDRNRAPVLASVFVAALLGWWNSEAFLVPVDKEKSDAFARDLVGVILPAD